jgi:hypothetical protein
MRWCKLSIITSIMKKERETVRKTEIEKTETEYERKESTPKYEQHIRLIPPSSSSTVSSVAALCGEAYSELLLLRYKDEK